MQTNDKFLNLLYRHLIIAKWYILLKMKQLN